MRGVFVSFVGREVGEVVDGMCVFFTSNFRSVRKLAIMSLVEETKVSVRAMSVGRAGRVEASRKVSLLASHAFKRYSFSSTSVLMVPKKVPKAGCLRGCGPLARLLASFCRGNNGMTTVYTTPNVFRELKFLGNEGTASCPSIVRRLGDTEASLRPMIMSKGMAADENLKATVSFDLSLVKRLRKDTGTRRVTRSIICMET